jgi:hypothetical protein
LFQLLGLQRDNLVIVVNLLDVLNLLSLRLGFDSCNLLLKFRFPGKTLKHTVDQFITGLCVNSSTSSKAECALSDQRVKLADTLLVDDLFQGVLVLRYFLVDDL